MNKMKSKGVFRSTMAGMLFLGSSSLILLGGLCNSEVTNTNTGINANTTANTNSQINTNAVVNTNTDTADWQTYTNEEYGFNFKYPKEWSVSVNAANTVTVLDPTSISKGKVTIENSESFSNMTEKEVLMIAPGKETIPLVDEKFLTINQLPAYRSLRQLKKGDLLRPTAPDSTERAESTSTEIEYRYLHDNNLIRLTFSIQGDTYENPSDIIDAVGQSFSI